MKKDKVNLGNEKKKKVPFNVFSKKGLAALALAGVMVASPLMLVGCSDGQDGKDGKDGANGPQWHYSTIDVIDGTLSGSVDFTATNGDFYIDMDNYVLYQMKNNIWEVVMQNFGKPGSTGATGPQGPAGGNGQDGQNGATWLTGTAITGTGTGISATIANSKVGDLYFNTETCNVYECIAENTWNWISNIKGQTGPQGPAGEDGDSVWLGYDGYIWIGEERTDVKYKEIPQTVAENTLELYNNKYFQTNTISTQGKQIALMQNYFSYINKTGYSECLVTEIQVYSENAGTLEIGLANVVDIVDARTNGTELITSNTIKYTLQEGLNTLSFNEEVGAEQTIVLGGNESSVNLYFSEEVTSEDVNGRYSYIDGETHSDVLENSKGVFNKLLISVDISLTKTQYTAIQPNLKSDFMSLQKNQNSLSAGGWKMYEECDASGNPTNALFAGKTITRIDLPISYVTDIVSPYLTLKVESLNGNKTGTAYSTHQLNVPTNQISDAIYDESTGKYTVNKWISITDINIEVPENHTIAIQYSGDTAYSCFKYSGSSNYAAADTATGEYRKVGSDYVCLPFDCYTSTLINMESILDDLREENEKAQLKNVLQGKSISVLGDSISVLSTIQKYGDSTNDVWWKQFQLEMGMIECVNNSISGTCAYGTVVDGECNAGWYDRCVNLHTDTLTPDIITVFLGTNDYDTDVECGSITEDLWINVQTEGFVPNNFVEAYAVMIYKMKIQYPDADIWCLNIPDNLRHENNTALRLKNNAIKEIAKHYDCYYVDICSLSGLEDSSYEIYGPDELHPNAEGMDLITNVLYDAMKDVYLSQE